MRFAMFCVLMFQIYLLGQGVEMLVKGDIASGVFNVVANVIFGAVNFYTIFIRE